MAISADRASGAFFLAFGLAMYLAVIPVQVETAEGGNIAPDTLPNIASLIIAVSGLWLMLKPTAHQIRDWRFFLTTGAYIAALALGIYAMSWFGFVYVAPVLALVIMLMIGERRPHWLALGVIGMPALIWAFVTLILDRSLP